MVSIIERKKGNKTFYYLEHSIREKNKIRKISKYLGSELPKNIEEIKRKFLEEIYQKKYFDKIDLIKKNFTIEIAHLPADIREKFLEEFMIKFTYDTNRIEGGTLTQIEVRTLLHDRISPAEKPIRDIKETETHKKVFYDMVEYKGDLDLETVLKWHKDLFSETKPEYAGKLRTFNVYVTGTTTTFPHHAVVKHLVNEFFIWYNSAKNKIHPVELAALAHLKFVRIHPFGDGNGRISRLIMNFVLHKFGYPMLSIDYKRRADYYKALDRSDQKNDEQIFVRNILNRYIRGWKNFFKKGSLVDVPQKKNR